ncbi:hypothetical protein JMJ35_001632 [Cladonia borealis]|uniref:Fumarylacetoacetase-like C-terminal domain-containing protein n=1 Tax=Cladonia borealis TaxID=184061 RepID=A0AA39R664_9LECA|nr:hypothetical protein JMJ35_001632 [Cladonia borealis]
MASHNLARSCRKVVCIGRNYADHIKELNNVRPKKPFFFLKPSSSILTPDQGPVLRPKGTNLHYEVELALIMGHNLVDHPEADAQGAIDSIAGYAIAIDMTARNMQEEAKKKGIPWTAAKGFDTFLPISHYIPKSDIPDPHDVELWLTVNGEERQRDSTALMLFRIPRILSEISRVMKLEEGDIVLTGTPKGVGPVQVGDVMRAGVRVGQKELKEGDIEVGVEEKGGLFVYEET